MNAKDEEYSFFYHEFQTFCKETAEFWALKATLVYAHKIGCKPCPKRYSFEEIFDFYSDHDGTIQYRRDLMAEEIRNMRKSVVKDRRLSAYEKKTEKRIRENESMVRGHEAFRFLQFYFDNHYGIHLDLFSEDPMLKDCINQFLVELN